MSAPQPPPPTSGTAARTLTGTLAALVIGAAVGIFTFTIAVGLIGSATLAVPLAALPAAVSAFVARRRLPASVAEAARWRPLAVVSLLASAIALVQLGRVAGYMVDPARTSLSMQPGDWMVHHSCLTAYYLASRAVHEGKNLYDESLYMSPAPSPDAPPVNRWLSGFRVDMFEYPPPFLLVPRAVELLAPDFLRFRQIWFGLDGLAVLVGFLLVAAHIGGIAGGRALLLAPLPWAALPTLSTLQVGNVQLPIIALSLGAMVLFERRRFALGGALLAYVTLSKLFPGLLLVYLAVRRQWRALAFTAALGLAILLSTLALMGWTPFASFLDHLPRLLSGEAFPALRRAQAIAINHSLVGLVFKLKLLGVWDLSFGAARVVGWIATLLAAAVTVALARRPTGAGERPIAWLVILLFATLRSPFLPQQYSVFPAMWLLTLLAAHAPSLRVLLLTGLGWAAMNIVVAIDAVMPMGQRLALSAIPQIVLLAVTILGIVALRPEPASPVARVPATHPQMAI